MGMEPVADDYVQYLRLEREEPSLNYLQRLIQHQLSLVPYETFSKFHYYQDGPEYVPSLPVFVRNLKEKGWGGTCFTLNMNFARLLKELGFDCSLVKVEPGHVAIMAAVNGRNYYVDVGYGSPITKPIDLSAKPQQVLHGFGEEISFSRLAENVYEINRKSNGKSFVKKRIIWKPLSEKDLEEEIRLSYLDDDENITMRRITAVRFNGHQCFYLRNSSVKVMTYRNISEIQLHRQDKWLETIREIYQIEEESLSYSVRFLEERGVTIFE